MRGAKFFGIGVALVVCISASLLVSSITWAKGKPQKTHTEYGYAKLTDTDDYVIQSDGDGQYIDCNVLGADGEDQVQIVLYENGALEYVHLLFGKMLYHYSEFDPSNRRVNFWFDIEVPETEMLEDYEGHEAVYDILVWEDRNKDNRRGKQDDTSGEYYLNDGSVHFPIKVYADGSAGWVQFVVDPGYDGTPPEAITQAAVDDFYPNDTDVDYWDTSEPDPDQILYYLDYGINAFHVAPVDRDGDEKPDTWILTATGSPVKLFVKKYIPLSRGKSPIRRVERVDLAEYSDGVPFQLIVSLNDLISYSLAPGKYNTLPTLWGKIKAR